MIDVLKLTLKLFVITLVAALLLGLTYVVTKDPIAEQELQEATLARQQVLDAASFEKYENAALSDDEAYAIVDEVYTGLDAQGNKVGATFKMTTKGYNSGLNLTVGINADGTVAGVSIGSNSETPGLGARAAEEAFHGQFTGKKADGALSVIKSGTPGESDISAIAGATITSRAVTGAVNTAAQCYAQFLQG